MKKATDICLECKEKLTLSKTTDLLTCKNKKCKKEYTRANYTNLVSQKNKDESAARELERLLDDEQFIFDTPSRTFIIGDLVNHYSGQELKILDSHQNKFYLLEKDSNKRWVRWHEIFLSSTVTCPILFNKRSESIDKRIQFSNRRIEGLLHYFFNGKINMNPPYQRGFVWEEEHKTKLIEAIFRGTDIGKVVIIRLPYKQDSYLYEILDGKQRLSTIVQFVEDRFQYQGYYFSQLQERDKSEFLSKIVSVGETDEGFTEDDKVRYFLSVNDTGVPQDPKLLESLRERLKSTATD